MNKQIYPLLIAQFLSAFADNAILFTVIAMVMQSAQLASWYVPALQSVFLVAFVVLAPWMGALADNHAKSNILILGNLVKAAGAGLLLLHTEPLIAYCIVGVGAAIYSPAKYGILPELAGHTELVKANSWIESSTILAILAGMVIGAKVADYSTTYALIGTIVLFLVSAAATLTLPKNINRPAKQENSQISQFTQQIRDFFISPRSRFAILGASLFWATAATLRVIIVAWAPAILLSHNASDIAQLTVFLAVGIIVGSAIVPKLIPLEQLQRARLPAYAMALLIIVLSNVSSVLPAQSVLFLIGMAGGMFIVPINAAVQELGQQAIGSGAAVALQGFFQNAAMLLAVGTYTYATAQGLKPVSAMLSLGVTVLLCAFLVAMRLAASRPVNSG
ncbi:MAG: lysophospholipid transporter LplT [Methylococcaceae bacterium]|nr:lysophospholipid transporter LplT [Methylococcaceae bacterium]